jgi:3' terminal RNA ribose 2'-O-methyltransferase Hen1
VQTFDLSFGRAHVFYAEASEDRCTAVLLLDVDPIGLVRRAGPPGEGFSLQQYVNDRPYVASSFMSVALAQVLGSALGGRCAARPELVSEALPLEVKIAALQCRGGDAFLRRLFEPLGYEITAQQQILDTQFPEWGESRYFTVTLHGKQRLCDLLAHLYVLIPVLDDDKHYWVGDDEIEKLLRKGEGWLAGHPEREAIAQRYLKHQRSLAREALSRLVDEDQPDPDADQAAHLQEEAILESQIQIVGPAATIVSPSPSELDDGEAEQLSLNSQRLATVLAVVRGSGASSVVDIGCGEGKLLRLLLNDKQFERILGMDVSLRSLKIASDRLKFDRLPPMKRQRIELMHGSLLYRDSRLSGFDAATCVEVIEHLDPPRLSAFERVLFEFARPKTIIITTPNREYNVMWRTLPAGQMRHRDHRFEWTRSEFQQWAGEVANRFAYTGRFLPIGPEDAEVGAPTQLGVFERCP